MSNTGTEPRRFLVALSFPGEKRDFVRDVAECLGEALGRKRVFFDEWYEAELARANLDTYLQDIYGEHSDLVVPFFCADYEKKPWCCRVEWPAIRAALTFDGRGDDYLMAMRFDDAPVKGFLKVHGYSDIGDRTSEAMADLILERLRVMGLHGSSGNDESGSGHSGAPFVVPYQFNRHFSDPHGNMGKLREALEGGGQAAVTQAISGLGGVGKTQLASQYAHVYRDEYSAVLWVQVEDAARTDGADSKDATSPELDFRAAVAALAAPRALNLEAYTAKEPDAAYEAVLGWLARCKGWLLVLDNADSEEAAEAAKSLAGSLDGGHVLITSRRGGDSEWGTVSELKLDVLEEKDATDFLLQRAKASEDEREDAHAVAKLLGGLFLALEQAAAWVREPGHSFRKYLDRAKELEGQIALLAKKVEGGTRYGRSIATTWLVTVESLSPLAQNILRLTCFYASSPIPDALLWKGDGEDDEPVDASRKRRPRSGREREVSSRWSGSEASLTEATVDDPLSELARYSLILRDDNSFTVHRLLQAAIYADLLEPERPDWVTWAVQRFNAYAPSALDVRLWPVWGVLRPHAERLIAVADPLAPGPPMATLLNQFALLLRSRAEYAHAETLMRRALHIDEAVYGYEHPYVAISLSNLAAFLWAANRLSEAEPLMRRGLGIDEASFGSDHPKVATRLNNLAQLLKDTNRLSEAESMMRRALEIDEAFYGPDHPDVAIRLNNLAGLLHSTNRLSDAEPLYRRAIDIHEASYGPDHPEVATGLNNLAQLLQATNRLSDAEPLMRRALAIDESSYGPDHPEVARDLNNLAQLLKATSRLSDAEPLMRRVLTIFEKSHGESHPNVATALNNLARLLHDTKRLSEAEPLMRRALAIDESSYGPDHPDVARDLNNLAQLLQAAKRLADAEPMMRRALEILVALTRATGYPPTHLRGTPAKHVRLLEEIGWSREKIAAELRGIMGDMFEEYWERINE